MTTETPPASVPYPAALERKPRVRQSLLAAFDRCALLAKLDMDLTRGWSTHAQARGQLFHRTAARCLELMAEQQENRIPPELAKEILYETLAQRDVDRKCPYCGSAAIERGETREGSRRCLTCTRAFETQLVAIPAEEVADLRMAVVKWAKDNTFQMENFVAAEERLTAKITYQAPGFDAVERELSGQIDALFFEPGDRAIIIDWKDTWGLPPETEVSFTGYFQQRFYAWLVMKAYPSVQSVTLREFYVRYSVPREGTVSRRDLVDVEAELAALVERFDRALQDEVFRPSPGKHCQFCPNPGACPIFPKARDVGAIDGPETARKYAAEAIVAKKVHDQRIGALKAYSDANGRVEIPVADAKGRTHYGYRESPSVVKPSREQLEAALRKVDRTSDLDLDRLFRTRTGTRFEPHAAGPVRPSPEDSKIAEQMRASLDRMAAREREEAP